MTPRFYLKYKDKEFSSIYMRICHKPNPPFKYPLVAPSTAKVLKIPTSCWNPKTQTPLKKSQIPTKYKDKDKSEPQIAIIEFIEKTINNIKSAVIEININAVNNNISITNEYLRKELNKKLKIVSKINDEAVLSLVEYYDRKISGMKDGSFVQPKNGEKYDKSTIDSHITCFKVLQGFDIYRGKITYFEDINNEWYDEYILFLNNEYEILDNKGEFDFFKEAYAPNTIGSKHIKNLKFIMERAFNEGLCASAEHKRDYFIRPKEDTFAIALNEDELRAIYDTKALTPKEQIAKDLFLVGAYTCLRYSDFSVINPHNFKEIDGVEVIEKPTKKTKDRAIIPILWDELKEIVERYDYRLPYLNSQSLNDLIKGIAERAKINRIEEFYQTKGGVTQLIRKPRHQLVASHTARRSAATNLIQQGYSYDEVRQLTGHKTNEQLQQYIKIDKADNAVSMAKKNKKKKDEK